MRTKEEYYESVKKNREIVSDPENLICPCKKTKCELHGKCLECVALHRFHKDHIPNCFQEYINDKITEIAKICELVTVEKEKTPPEYWDYVRQRDME